MEPPTPWTPAQEHDVDIYTHGVELGNVFVRLHGPSEEQLERVLGGTPFHPISIAHASDDPSGDGCSVLELRPDVDLMAFRHFVRSIIPGTSVPDVAGHKTCSVQKASLPGLDYSAIAGEAERQGKCVMFASLRNAARDPAACHVLIPQIGDEHIYHHKTGAFSVNAAAAHYNPTFLYLEPGDSIWVHIIFHASEKRAKMVPYRPHYSRVISKNWLVARPDLAQRMWA